MKRRMLFVALTLAALCALFALSVGAETSGYYTYTVSNGEATITDVDTSISGVVAIPSTLDGYPVTSIGDIAFYNCDSLTSVTIPEGVTNIGGRAFDGCSSLTSVTIPSSVTSIGNSAFYNCDSLTSVTIPSSVTSIGSSAFNGCSSLTSVTIPSSVTSIGTFAFYDCSSLTSVTIPSSVTSIGTFAFYDCSSLTSVTIPSSVTDIGNAAFACGNLRRITVNSDNEHFMSDSYGVLFNKVQTELIQYPCGNTRISYTIPSSVTSIGDSAFDGCSSLTSVTIPSSVTSIGDSAFDGCSSLTSVTIPEGVTSIGLCTFYNCSSLTSVTIPSSVTSIGNSAFHNCDSLTSVTIPSSVTSIAISAFESCSSLTSVTIPSSVTSIGTFAFYDCSSLTSVTIPSSVTSISLCTFYNCSSLTSVTIPSSVTYIGIDAFAGCSSLTNIFGYRNSYAETYATSNGYTFYAIDEPAIVTQPAPATYSLGEVAAPLTVEITPTPGVVSYAWYKTNENGYWTQLISTEATLTPDTGVAGTRRYIVIVSVTYDGETYTVNSDPVTIEVIDKLPCGDNLTWTLENGTLTITGYGAMYDYSPESPAPWYADRASITAVELVNTSITDDAGVVYVMEITHIGSYAFADCTALTQLEIKGKTATIGENAFAGVGDGFKLMAYTDSPAAVYTIHHDIPFAQIPSANYTDPYGFGANVTGTFDSATAKMIYTLSLRGSGTMPDYGDHSAAPWYGIGNGVKYTGSVPGGFGTIDTSNILLSDMQITFSPNITSIGRYAFSHSDGLTLALPDSVTYIADHAFYHGDGMTITLPKTVTYIDANAFVDCTNLRLICQNDYAANHAEAHGIPYTYITWETCYQTVKPFQYYHISGRGAMPNYSPEEPSPWTELVTGKGVKINSGITHIGANAFADWSELSITIPPSVTSIHADAFAGSRNITILGNLGSTAETYAKRNGIAFIAVDAFALLDGSVFQNITYALGDTPEPITVTATASVGTLSCVWKRSEYSNNNNYPGLIGEETVVREDSSTTSTLTASCLPDTSAVGTFRYAVEFSITQTYADGSPYTMLALGASATIDVIESAGTITAATWDKGRDWFHISLDDVTAARSLQMVLRDANGNVLTTMEKPAQDPRYLYDEKLNILDPTTGEIALIHINGTYYVEGSEGTYRVANEDDFVAVDRTSGQSGSGTGVNGGVISTIGEDEYLIDNNSVRWVYKYVWLYVTPAGTIAHLNAYPSSYGEYPTTGQVYNSAGTPTKVLYFHKGREGWIDDANVPDIRVDQLIDNNGVIWTKMNLTGLWIFELNGTFGGSFDNYISNFGGLPTTAVDAHNRRYTFENGTWTMEGSSNLPGLPGIGLPGIGGTLPTTPTTPTGFPLRDRSFTTFLSTNNTPADGWTQTAWTPSASAVPTTLELVVDGRTVDSFALSVNASDWASVLPAVTPAGTITAAVWQPAQNAITFSLTDVTAGQRVELVLRSAQSSTLTRLTLSPAQFAGASLSSFLSTNNTPADGWTQTAWTPEASAVPTTLELVVDGRTVDSFALTIDPAAWGAAFGTTAPAGTISGVTWQSSNDELAVSLSGITADRSVELVLRDANGAVLSTNSRTYAPQYLYDASGNILDPRTGAVALYPFGTGYLVPIGEGYRNATEDDLAANAIYICAGMWFTHIVDNNDVAWYLTNRGTWVYSTAAGSYQHAGTYLSTYGAWPSFGILYPRRMDYCHFDPATATWSTQSTTGPDGFDLIPAPYVDAMLGVSFFYYDGELKISDNQIDLYWTQTPWTPNVEQVPAFVELYVDGQLMDSESVPVKAEQWQQEQFNTIESAVWGNGFVQLNVTLRRVNPAESVRLELRDANGNLLTSSQTTVNTWPIADNYRIIDNRGTVWMYMSTDFSVSTLGTDRPVWHANLNDTFLPMPLYWDYLMLQLQFSGIGDINALLPATGVGRDGVTYTWNSTALTWQAPNGTLLPGAIDFTTFLSTNNTPADGWTQTAWTPTASAVPTTLELVVGGRTADTVTLTVSAADWAAAFPAAPVVPAPTPTEKLAATWEPDENRFAVTFNATATESVKLVLKDADGEVLTETEKAISALPVSPSFYITTTASTIGGYQTGINATWYFTTSAYSDVPAWHMLAEGSSELMPWRLAFQFSGIGILGANFGSGTGSDGLTYTWDSTAMTWTYNSQPLGCVGVNAGYLYTNGTVDTGWTQSAWTPTAGRYPDRLELHVDGMCVETCAIAINVADWNAAFPAAPVVPAITGLLVHDQPYAYTTLQLRQNGAVVQTIGVCADAAGAQSFTLSGVAAGTYDLHIIRPGSLTTVIRGITVNGITPVDLTAHANPAVRCIELVNGDVNGDGVINVVDVALVRGEGYMQDEASVSLPYAG